ncbi:hypothetical protein G5B10_11740 [Fluviicola sp. SGL-29]|nr:hypothetical protein [Fluviicola sp. SGL-29]
MKLKKVIFFWLVAVSLFFVGSFVVGASERKMIPITVETAWILCNISFITSLSLIVFTLIKSTKISLKLISGICLVTLLYFSFLSVKTQIALYDDGQLEKPNYAVTTAEQNFESHHAEQQEDEGNETDTQEENIDEIISQLNFRDGIPTNSVFTFIYNRNDGNYEDKRELTIDLCEREMIYKRSYLDKSGKYEISRNEYETYHITSVENDGEYQLKISSNLQSGRVNLNVTHYVNLLKKTVVTKTPYQPDKAKVYDEIQVNNSTCSNNKILFGAIIYDGVLREHISQYKLKVMEHGKIHLEKTSWKVSYSAGHGSVQGWLRLEEDTKTTEHHYYYFHPSYIGDLKNSNGKGLVQFKCYPDKAFVFENSRIGGGIMTVDFDKKFIQYEVPSGTTGYRSDFACKDRNGNWGHMAISDSLFYSSNPFLEKEFFEKK